MFCQKHKAFDKVIGYEFIKDELDQIADTLRNRDVYTKMGVKMPSGLLLYGEPGVGKTLMATAMIEASGCPCYTCRKDQPDGDFIRAIRKAFNQAQENAPAIVFLDDLDKFANEDEDHRDAEEYVTVQSCIDDVKHKDVFVLATVNNMRKLPKSLRRAGRFDRLLKMDVPTGADATAIVKHYLRDKKLDDSLDISFVAKALDGHTCAELETVINEAGLYAGYERVDYITVEHFVRACMHVIYQVHGDDYDQAMFAREDLFSLGLRTHAVLHEAGHAAVSEILRPGSVTIVSLLGSHWDSGFVAYCADSKTSANGPLPDILVTLAGMAAVDQWYGNRGYGNSSDLDKVFQMVETLVKNNSISGLCWTERDFSDSDILRAQREAVVAAKVEEYYCKAKKILALNQSFFGDIIKKLSEKCMLTQMDLREIRKKHHIIPFRG